LESTGGSLLESTEEHFATVMDTALEIRSLKDQLDDLQHQDVLQSEGL